MRRAPRGWSSWTRLGACLTLGGALAAVPSPAVLARGGGRAGGGARAGGAARGGGGTTRAPQSRPSTPTTRTNAPASTGANAPARTTTGGANARTNAGNRTNNVQNRTTNNVHIDRSRDVNVERNTFVRAAPRPYARAPYVYRGRGFYAHNAYRYHRYAPYSWGAGFHPFGFFAATLAATAVAVTIADMHYHYDQGVWYLPANGGYTVVTAPVGATVTVLPPGAAAVSTTTYYYGGAYYEKHGDEYEVVAPTAGTVVEHLPEGGEEVTIGDRKYVKFGETYYQPAVVDGKNVWEVVEIKPATTSS